MYARLNFVGIFHSFMCVIFRIDVASNLLSHKTSPVGVHLQVHPVQLYCQVNGELVCAGVGGVVQNALHGGPGVRALT